jgi:methanol--5-hydroxybenzimidazolylcobamide Co-methyltransferase
MFLAGGLLSNEMPHTFAALVRALGAVRSLVAFENGAVGPAKDCGYENVILKAITGCPMSMEGKTSACAHSDLMGNLVMASCDLWSNEAVQYGEMFGGTTPQVFMEMLGYDVAQMNTALQMGHEKILRDIFVQSDKYRDPQALILSPEEAYQIGGAIVSETDFYPRSVKAVRKAAEIIGDAGEKKLLPLTRLENDVIQRLMTTVDALPVDSETFLKWGIQEFSRLVPEFRAENYGL